MCKVILTATPEIQKKIKKAMKQDGWCTEDGDGKLIAHHDHVFDQTSARERLHKLGLLTSSNLQLSIE